MYLYRVYCRKCTLPKGRNLVSIGQNKRFSVGILHCLFVAKRLEEQRFSEALEAAEDSDLRWRSNLLIAVSLALGDAGDANAASVKAALGLQHAEAFALRERESAEAARGVLNEVTTSSGGAGASIGVGVGGVGVDVGGSSTVVVIPP